MPTKAEWEELLNEENCTWTWQEDYSGVSGAKGWLVTSKKSGHESNSIFLPVTNFRSNTTDYTNNNPAFYWSSSVDTETTSNGSIVHGDAWTMEAHYSSVQVVSEHAIGLEPRREGLTVRPVCP